MVVSFCPLICARLYAADTVLLQETFNYLILGGWAAGTLLGLAFLRLGWLGTGPSEKLPEKGR